MKDILRTILDVGEKVQSLREADGIRPTVISQKSGRSRDVLNRLERGKDISLSSLLDILTTMGYALEIVRTGPPTLEEMQRRTKAALEESDES